MRKPGKDKLQQKSAEPLELLPAMSKEEADAQVRQLGVSQADIDMDISHLDMDDFVDEKYLAAIAARMIREGKMPNFNNPQVKESFKQTLDDAFESAQEKPDGKK